jgi:ribulose kinase
MDILVTVNRLAPGAGRINSAFELTASLALLDRWTGNRTIRAEHAAIAGERLQSFAAAFAVIEELAGVGGHGFIRLMAAFRASQR